MTKRNKRIDDAAFMEAARLFVQAGERLEHYEQLEPDSYQADHFRKLREHLRHQLRAMLGVSR